eukprot:6185103-Amphidinium_carterae.1
MLNKQHPLHHCPHLRIAATHCSSDFPPHLRFQVTPVSRTASPHLRLPVPLACFEPPVQCAPALPEVKAHATHMAIHRSARHRFRQSVCYVECCRAAKQL